jgi:hypothetical protein
MKPPLSAPHGTSLGTTAGITSVITLVAAVSVVGQCANLAGVAAALAACALIALILGAGSLYLARNGLGHALDLAAHDAAAAGIAAARALTRFHLGMAGVFAGCGFACAFRVALPRGGALWLVPAAAFLVALIAAVHAAGWAREARRRSDGA